MSALEFFTGFITISDDPVQNWILGAILLSASGFVAYAIGGRLDYLAVGKVCGRGHPGTPFGGLAAPDPQMYTHTRTPLRRSFCRRTHPAVTRIRQQKPRARRGTEDDRRGAWRDTQHVSRSS